MIKYVISFALLFVILSIGLLNAYNFLSISRPVQPDLLVVEGWLHRDGLYQAKEEFIHHRYKLILTTGIPNTDGFLMGSNGRLVFETRHKIPASKDGIYNISLTIRGTKANKKYPHFKLFADSVEIGDDYTSKYKKDFLYNARLSNPPDSIMLEFDNDMYTNLRDRNLYVYSVSVDKAIFKADNEQVICYFRKNGRYYLYQRLSPNSAQDAAKYLNVLGIPDSLIVPLVTMHSQKSRTYSTALAVKKWLDIHGNNTRRNLNIFTQGPHARRSFILYKKALGDSAGVGIISGKIQEFNSRNWWKSIRGWQSVLYEITGLVYISLFL